METPYTSVLDFYKKFNQQEFLPEEGSKASLGEDRISNERLELKMSLIAEEFSELVEAVLGRKAGLIISEAWKKALDENENERDLVEMYDALSDLIYVIYGLSIEAGGDLDATFREVHLSNMSKLGEDGKPVISDGVTPAPDGKVKPAGKILKGDGYFDPDLKAILDGTDPDRTPKNEK